MKPTNFSLHVSNFLGKHLPGVSGLSPNTIMSYRDMFKILLNFFEVKLNLQPEQIKTSHFTEENIIKFLSWLEDCRKNSPATRNIRLAALHSFARYVSRREPEYMHEMQLILSIPFKKGTSGKMDYVSVDAMKKILDLPLTSTSAGLRDATMLSLMYDSGCRVQELCDMKPSDLRLDAPATIRINGKENKIRIVTMMEPMKELLMTYLQAYHLDKPENSHRPLFSNRSGGKLTRKGVAYILGKYFEMAKKSFPELFPDQFTPHCIRHSRAMHMLQAGINLIYIRDLLGHVDIKTTEIYARIDSEMKRKALEKGYDIVPDGTIPIWQEDKSLLEWLTEL